MHLYSIWFRYSSASSLSNKFITSSSIGFVVDSSLTLELSKFPSCSKDSSVESSNKRSASSCTKNSSNQLVDAQQNSTTTRCKITSNNLTLWLYQHAVAVPRLRNYRLQVIEELYELNNATSVGINEVRLEVLAKLVVQANLLVQSQQFKAKLKSLQPSSSKDFSKTLFAKIWTNQCQVRAKVCGFSRVIQRLCSETKEWVNKLTSKHAKSFDNQNEQQERSAHGSAWIYLCSDSKVFKLQYQRQQHKVTTQFIKQLQLDEQFESNLVCPNSVGRWKESCKGVSDCRSLTSSIFRLGTSNLFHLVLPSPAKRKQDICSTHSQTTCELPFVVKSFQRSCSSKQLRSKRIEPSQLSSHKQALHNLESTLLFGAINGTNPRGKPRLLLRPKGREIYPNGLKHLQHLKWEVRAAAALCASKKLSIAQTNFDANAALVAGEEAK